MKKLCAMLEIVFAALTVSAMLCTAQLAPPVAVARGQTAPAPLKPLQNIPLLGVDGALDHMGIDVQGQRLFVPAE